MMWDEDMLYRDSQEIGEELFYIFNILAAVYKRRTVISGDGDGTHTEKSRMQHRCCSCYTFMQNKSDQK